MEPATEANGTEAAGRASARIAQLAQSLDGERVTLGALVDRLGHAGFGFVLLVLTLVVLVPIPGPVGMVLGTVIAGIALQLLFGARRLWLPEVLRRQSLPAPVVRSILEKALPYLQRVEAWLTPRRWRPLTGLGARSLLATPLILLGATISLPIPLGNFMPAFALLAVSLGLIVRDGAAILAGLALTVLAIGWTAVLIFAGGEIVGFAARLLH